MNTKAKGSRNEHRSMQLLESSGYACTRAAASLGVFDIVGVSATDVVLVQSKTRNFPGSVEMGAIRNFQWPAAVQETHSSLARPGTPARCPQSLNWENIRIASLYGLSCRSFRSLR